MTRWDCHGTVTELSRNSQVDAGFDPNASTAWVCEVPRWVLSFDVRQCWQWAPLVSTPFPLLFHSFSTPFPLLFHSFSTPFLQVWVGENVETQTIDAIWCQKTSKNFVLQMLPSSKWGKPARFSIPLNLSLVPSFIFRPAEGSAGVPRSELHRSPPQSTADNSGHGPAAALLRLVRLQSVFWKALFVRCWCSCLDSVKNQRKGRYVTYVYCCVSLPLSIEVQTAPDYELQRTLLWAIQSLASMIGFQWQVGTMWPPIFCQSWGHLRPWGCWFLQCWIRIGWTFYGRTVAMRPCTGHSHAYVTWAQEHRQKPVRMAWKHLDDRAVDCTEHCKTLYQTI